MRVTPSYCHFTLLYSLPCKQRGFSESFPWKKRCIETSCVESPDINNQLAHITTKAPANYTFRPRKPTSNRYPNLENQETHNMCGMSTACPQHVHAFPVGNLWMPCVAMGIRSSHHRAGGGVSSAWNPPTAT